MLKDNDKQRLLSMIRLFIFTAFFFVCARAEIPYTRPTERYIKANGWETISSGLKECGLSMAHRNLFDRVWKREEPGFVGYHGSTQNYRIYQDIIRIILEEHLCIPIRDDFHFFRIPAHPDYHHTSLEDYGSAWADYHPAHFVCMNYALYGNFRFMGWCSYYYFFTNSSAQLTSQEAYLGWLFERIGLDTSLAHQAFAIGKDYLEGNRGVLFQIFDISHFHPQNTPLHDFSDKLCSTGLEGHLLSSLYQGHDPSLFYDQCRMLMTNHGTLNPFSPLIIKRYDTVDPNVSAEYEQALRSFIKGLSPDPEKVAEYRKELFCAWEVIDDQVL